MLILETKKYNVTLSREFYELIDKFAFDFYIIHIIQDVFNKVKKTENMYYKIAFSKEDILVHIRYNLAHYDFGVTGLSEIYKFYQLWYLPFENPTETTLRIGFMELIERMLIIEDKEDKKMKRYNIIIKKFTGSYDFDGNKIYDSVASINSNNIYYVWKMIDKKCNEIDLHCGNYEIHDNNGNYDRDIEMM